MTWSAAPSRCSATDDVVLSFGRRTLLEARRRRPSLRVLQHVGYGVSIRAASSYAWAVGFHDPRVTARGLERARRLGLETTVYTVNDERRMRRSWRWASTGSSATGPRSCARSSALRLGLELQLRHRPPRG